MNKISRKGFIKIAAAAAMSGVTAGALAACNAASGSASASTSGAAGQYTPGKLRAGDRLRPTPEGRKRLMDSAQTPHDITAIESWDRHGLVGADRTGNGHLLRVARDERIKLTLQPTAKDFEVLAA